MSAGGLASILVREAGVQSVDAARRPFERRRDLAPDRAGFQATYAAGLEHLAAAAMARAGRSVRARLHQVPGARVAHLEPEHEVLASGIVVNVVARVLAAAADPCVSVSLTVQLGSGGEHPRAVAFHAGGGADAEGGV